MRPQLCSVEGLRLHVRVVDLGFRGLGFRFLGLGFRVEGNPRANVEKQECSYSFRKDVRDGPS